MQHFFIDGSKTNLTSFVIWPSFVGDEGFHGPVSKMNISPGSNRTLSIGKCREEP